MSQSRQWDDLKPRLITGLSLVAFGIAVVSLGGWVFALTAALISGIMIWELTGMTNRDQWLEALALGGLAGLAVILARQIEAPTSAVLLLLPAVAGALVLFQHKAIYAVYAVGIVVASYGLVVFRDTYGVVWLFWLMITVAMTDVAGYFGGRLIGGAKFWPAISPKKTWAGIVSGWVAAVLVSLVFLAITDAGRDLIWIAALLSFSSQMGDIAESAVKRRMGVKDSSQLLPGHGGLFDRFDALLGAALFMLLTALVVDVPELRF
ncbi:MAG: phosphatidate cytidylyltransferase [Pseudomonadota bacterium]